MLVLYVMCGEAQSLVLEQHEPCHLPPAAVVVLFLCRSQTHRSRRHQHLAAAAVAAAVALPLYHWQRMS